MPGIRLKRRRWSAVLLGVLISLGVYLNWPSSTHSDGIRDKINFADTMVFREKRFREYQRTQSTRTGPGEMGKGVSLSMEEMKENAERIKMEGFNVAASERIALDRSLRDNRDSM